MWNEHLCSHTFSVKSTFDYWQKLNQHLWACSREIDIWLFLKWNQHLWDYAWTWNQRFAVSDMKSTSLSLSTICCFWSEIDIFALACYCEIMLFAVPVRTYLMEINTWRGWWEKQSFLHTLYENILKQNPSIKHTAPRFSIKLKTACKIQECLSQKVWTK